MVKEWMRFFLYLFFVGIIIVTVIYFVDEKKLHVLRNTSTILSIIMTLISLYSANKVIEYKFQICHKVEMKNALKALRKNNEDLHKNINTPEKVRSNLLSDLIPIIEQIFRNDDVLKRQYKRCLKRVKKTDKITKENVQEFALEIDNIMKSLEKMYE